MSIGTIVFLMIAGTKVQVGFELAVRGLYFADQVVILPRCLFIKCRNIGAQKVSTEALFLRRGLSSSVYRPCDWDFLQTPQYAILAYFAPVGMA